MQVNLKQGSFYIYLPKKLYNDLKEIPIDNAKFNLALLGFLLHLILRHKFLDKNLENGSEWTPLCSCILKKYNHKYFRCDEHLDFLVKNGFLDFQPHISNVKGMKNRCKGYKIANKYSTSESPCEVKIYDPRDKFYRVKLESKELTKIISDRLAERRAFANLKAHHLTKWLDADGFEIDSDKAIEYVSKTYSKESDKNKLLKRELIIQEFETLHTKYSRQGKDDRLHSYFTTLPKDLKRFITYKGFNLVEVDIRSSQPFILSFILETIITEYESEINTKGKITLKIFSNRLLKKFNKLINTEDSNLYKLDIRRICNDITIMFLKSSVTLDFTEIKNFISLIRGNDIYSIVGDKLLELGSIWQEEGLFFVKLHDRESKRIKTFSFNSLRDCAKKIVLNALYTSANYSGVPAIRDFRYLFPEVSQFLDIIKATNKADLPILMQQIESKCVIDYCSKKMAKKHPKMLLLSRHDSLVTTEDNEELLFDEFRFCLKKYFGVDVKLGVEKWFNP